MTLILLSGIWNTDQGLEWIHQSPDSGQGWVHQRLDQGLRWGHHGPDQKQGWRLIKDWWTLVYYSGGKEVGVDWLARDKCIFERAIEIMSIKKFKEHSHD